MEKDKPIMRFWTHGSVGDTKYPEFIMCMLDLPHKVNGINCTPSVVFTVHVDWFNYHGIGIPNSDACLEVEVFRDSVRTVYFKERSNKNEGRNFNTL